ncbi:Cysteine-rich VLP domain-containing protein, partial [Dysosmobacter welbionis]
GPGADSAPGPSFARRKPHGLPSPLCVLNFSAPAAHRGILPPRGPLAVCRPHMVGVLVHQPRPAA